MQLSSFLIKNGRHAKTELKNSEKNVQYQFEHALQSLKVSAA